jgi:hypothetical protein
VISFEEASRRVSRYLSRPDPYQTDQIEFVIVDTIERPWGWVFVYDSADHVRSGADEDMVLGNAPILVERKSGRLFVTGTAESTEHYIALYEQGKLEDLELVDPSEYGC